MKWNSLLLILILNLCFLGDSYAQADNNTDKKEEVLRLIDSSRSAISYSFPDSKKYINKALDISRAIQDTSLISKSLLVKGRIFHMNRNSKEGFKLLLEALKYAKNINEPLLIAEIYDNLGLNLRNNNNFEDALKYYEKSMNIRKKYNDTIGIANIYVNLGCISRDRNHFEGDKDAFNTKYQESEIKPYKVELKNKFPPGIKNQLIDESRAIAYFDSALWVMKDIPEHELNYEVYYLKGILYSGAYEYEKALLYMTKFAKYQQKAHGEIASNINMILANIYQGLGMEEEADKNLNLAIEKFNNDSSIETKEYFYFSLAMYYNSGKDYYNAFQNLLKTRYLRTIAQTKNAQKNISRVQSDYEKSLEKIRADKLEVERQNQELLIRNRNIIIIAISIFSIVLLISFYFQYQRKNQLRDSHLKIEKQKIKLEETIILKDKFYSIISHDIKNPLLGLEMTLENIMQNESDITPELRSKIVGLHYNSSELSQLFNNLLEWINIQSGAFRFNPRTMNLSNTTKRVLKINHSFIANKNLEIINNVPDDTNVLADSNMLFSIIHNILHNAIKFSPQNGTIILDVNIENEFANYSIIDNGMGIEENDLKLLFTSKINLNSVNPNRGSGLGLRVVKEFVECCGGKVHVSSKVGEGTKVSFTLNLSDSIIKIPYEKNNSSRRS